MSKVVILIFVLFISTITFAEQIPNHLGLDWRTDGPTGKNWIKVTDIHYLNKNSIIMIEGTIYQAELCNELKLPNGANVWNYFNVRVDCRSRQAYSQNENEWIGPVAPTDYDEAVLKKACK